MSMFGFLTKIDVDLMLERLETRLKRLEEADGIDVSDLEARLERLELDRGERHLQVANTLEKVLRQLEARDRKRGESEPADAPAEPEETRSHPALRPQPVTAELARRFRRA